MATGQLPPHFSTREGNQCKMPPISMQKIYENIQPSQRIVVISAIMLVMLFPPVEALPPDPSPGTTGTAGLRVL